MLRKPIAASLLALAVPAAAQGATLTTDRQCYVDAPGQVMTVTGAEWAPGSAWSVTGAGITEFGDADPAGAFAFEVPVPDVVAQPKPRTLTLTGNQDGAEVATVDFKVVSFLVQPKSVSGKPTGKTSWAFSGFTPAKPIYVHVKRGGKVYTEKAGKGDAECGTLKTRLRRLPAVPASAIKFGQYKVYVDNSRKFRKGGLQYRATITISRTFD